MILLKQKSDENIQASQLLIKQCLYASSVHCSYYACVQLMLHILRSHLKLTEEKIKEVQDEGAKTHGGFHAWIIAEMAFHLLKKQNKYITAKDFRDGIEDLRRLRRDADYENKTIEEKNAKKACETACNILKILSTHFTQ